MTRFSRIAGYWLGLCPKAPVICASQIIMGDHPDQVLAGGPEGGGPGSVRRGIGSALAGMRTLNRNRQLLWFTLLTGLVLAGNIIAQGVLGYVTWTMIRSETEWIVLNFIIEFATLFCLVFLLTGLVLSVSSPGAGRASFFEGLAGAKKYLRAVAAWSFVLALAGMLLFGIYFYSPDWVPRNPLNLAIFGTLYGWVGLLAEFPFNPTFAQIVSDPAIYGEQSLAYWIYPSGILQTLAFSAINLLLFIMTPFVVPLIVLERKTPGEAVRGSFAMMRTVGAEAAACAVFLGIVACGVFLTYLLVQAASGMAAPEGVDMVRPEPAWIAFALVYDGALACFAMIMTTIGGIAALDLFTSAKNRQPAAESAGAMGRVT